MTVMESSTQNLSMHTDPINPFPPIAVSHSHTKGNPGSAGFQ